MRSILIAGAVLLASVTLVHAEKPDAPRKAPLPLCEIWASVEAPNVHALIEHEHWHCWGWTHSVRHSPLLAKTKAERDAYRAAIAPWHVRLRGQYPNAVTYFLTEKDAAKACGSWGCASGGLQRN